MQPPMVTNLSVANYPFRLELNIKNIKYLRDGPFPVELVIVHLVHYLLHIAEERKYVSSALY